MVGGSRLDRELSLLYHLGAVCMKNEFRGLATFKIGWIGGRDRCIDCWYMKMGVGDSISNRRA